MYAVIATSRRRPVNHRQGSRTPTAVIETRTNRGSATAGSTTPPGHRTTVTAIETSTRNGRTSPSRNRLSTAVVSNLVTSTKVRPTGPDVLRHAL